MIKSNPKTKQTKLGLNNIHYYTIMWVANDKTGEVTGRSCIEKKGLLALDAFKNKLQEKTNYVKLNKYEFLKLTQ